eukprot:sb/3468847/
MQLPSISLALGFFFTFPASTYGLMNLLLAVIYNQFRQHFKILIIPDQDEEDAGPSFPSGTEFLALSTVYSILDILRMDNRYKKYLYKHLDDSAQTDVLDREDFVKLFLDIETDYSDWEKRQLPRFRSTEIPRIKVIVTHRIFEMIGTLLALVNTIALIPVLTRKPDEHTGIRKGAEVVLYMNIFVTIYFTLEQGSCKLGRVKTGERERIQNRTREIYIPRVQISLPLRATICTVKFALCFCAAVFR